MYECISRNSRPQIKYYKNLLYKKSKPNFESICFKNLNNYKKIIAAQYL
jgi:hypothetical protein